jgi:hypothetical protein
MKGEPFSWRCSSGSGILAFNGFPLDIEAAHIAAQVTDSPQSGGLPNQSFDFFPETFDNERRPFSIQIFLQRQQMRMVRIQL